MSKLTPEGKAKLKSVLDAIELLMDAADGIADFVPDVGIRAAIEIGARAVKAVAEFLERVLTEPETESNGEEKESDTDKKIE